MMDVMDEQTARDLDAMARDTAAEHARLDATDHERVMEQITEHAKIRASLIEWEITDLLRAAGQTGVSVDEVAARWGVHIDAARDVLESMRSSDHTPLIQTETGRWRLR